MAIKTLYLFVFIFLPACSIFGESKNPYGPWHGFIYEQTARGEETRVYQGDFVGLTNCMDMMQAKTIYNKYAYFCGYNCKGFGNDNAAYTCEKVMGSPLNALPSEKWSNN